MAFQSKKLPGSAAYGNSVRLSYTGSETVPAVTEVTDQNGNNPTNIVIDKIQKIQNFSGSSVAGPGGFSFAPGNWDFGEGGGLVLDTVLNAGDALPGDDNCVVIVRGYVDWSGVTDHSKSP